MSASLYMKTIELRKIVDRLTNVGVGIYSVRVSTDDKSQPERDAADLIWYHQFDLEFTTSWQTPEENERQAVEWLNRYGGYLVRHNGGIRLQDRLSTGVTYQIYFGEGVCERVVVGQEWVEPRAGYYRDVTEVRCP